MRIRSALPLPGAVPAGDAESPPDVEIVYATTPPGDAGRVWGPYRVTSPDQFEFTMPGLARFICLARCRILVDPVPGADQAHLSNMLIATVLPALLWARGDVVLHAAAFTLDGANRAIAVAGASGSGKSTVLARALTMGAYQIADDSICLRVQDDAAMASGLAGGHFERMDDDGARMFRPVPPRQWRAAGRVGALLVLQPGTVRPRRLSGVDAIQALLTHRHRPRIIALLGMEAASLSTMAMIAQTVPVVAIPPLS
uniref:hypothetical protein n=1 Tax=Sphingomonas bacterium TaxID=1895847 RepID=UPI002628F55C|nr:hypothetical protein [Sphingomonas bacterium]